jgi:tripartite-type tricarboxylate transporter receptor subunit TctC
MSVLKWFAGGLLAILTLFGLVLPAGAQSFPSKPITLIVPFAAGGPSDTIARLIGKHMGETLKTQMIVENVGGAGGTMGSSRLIQSPADGYTLLVHHLAIAAAPSLYRNLPYRTSEAFTPIGLINAGPYVLTGQMGLAKETGASLLDRIRREGSKISMAHSGVGAGSHLCATLLSQSLGTEVTQIPYRGASQSVQDLISGHIDLLCEQTINALPHIESKKAKAFAVTSLTRVEQLPDVPTLNELGIKGFDLTNWHGLYAPGKLPAPLLATLNEALRKALADPVITQRFKDLGTTLFPEAERSPAAHSAKFAAEIARWSEVVKKAGIEPQ